MQIAYDILCHLSDGKFHSGTSLAKALRVSRSSIWKGIEVLRQLGVDVQAVSGRGYRWHCPSELLAKNQIMTFLPSLTKEKIARLEVIPIIDSTNDHLISRIPFGLHKGTVCLAEAQTKGRGRRGKKWQSPLGTNIYLSLYWQFSCAFSLLSGLSLVAAIAVLQALETLSPLPKTLGIKWPNDIWYNNAKLAGILVETSLQPQEANQKEKSTHVVIGMGINVNLPDAVGQTNWTDLSKALGKVYSRNLIIARILEALITNLQRFEQEGFHPFQLLWQQYDLLAGKQVALDAPQGEEKGVVEGVNERGELLVKVGQTLKAVRYGDISVIVEGSTCTDAIDSLE